MAMKESMFSIISAFSMSQKCLNPVASENSATCETQVPVG